MWPGKTKQRIEDEKDICDTLEWRKRYKEAINKKGMVDNQLDIIIDDLTVIAEFLAKQVINHNKVHTGMYINEFYYPKAITDDKIYVIKSVIRNLKKLTEFNNENLNWYENKLERVKLNNGRYSKQDILEDVIQDLVKLNKDLMDNKEEMKELNGKLKEAEKENKCLELALKKVGGE